MPAELRLPPPDAAALAHSRRLAAALARNIVAAGGWLDFADFMDGLLYAPGLGYYAAGAARFNAGGDFVTAPEVSPLFAATLARAIAPALQALPAACVLEPGAGTGRLAAALLPALERLGQLPERYLILEPSPALRAEQATTLASLPPALATRVAWIDDLPRGLVGVVVANEVLDAMPVHLLRHGADGEWQLRGVALDAAGNFCWSDRRAPDALLAALFATLPPDVHPAPGALLELGLAARRWTTALGGCLREGLVVLIDYGFAAREFHHPQRRSGTLMCHYRHHAHDDPFYLPGLQDVTAHLDFTSIAHAARAAGLVLCAFETQAAWLLQHGILDALPAGLVPGSVDWLRQTTAVQTLLSPAEMGELFKVLVVARDPAGRLAGFHTPAGSLAAAARLGLTGPAKRA